LKQYNVCLAAKKKPMTRATVLLLLAGAAFAQQAPRPPQFVSPKGNIDPKTGVFVTEVRDTGTGKVTFQYPSKKAVAAYARSNHAEKADSEAPRTSSGEGQTESKPRVEASASADAVTDGTKDSQG